MAWLTFDTFFFALIAFNLSFHIELKMIAKNLLAALFSDEDKFERLDRAVFRKDG